MAQGLIGTNDGQEEVFDVKISWRHGVSVHQTGFSVRRSAALLATPQDLAEAVDTALRTPLRAMLPAADTYLGVDVVNPITKLGATFAPAGIVGTVPGPAMGPAFLAAVIALKSERRSRIGQGRMFLPLYFETWVDADNIGPEGVTGMNNFITALMNNFSDVIGPQPWLLVNWHRALAADRPNGTNPGVPAVPATWYDVTAARLNLGVTSLRSRKAGVGS